MALEFTLPCGIVRCRCVSIMKSLFSASLARKNVLRERRVKLVTVEIDGGGVSPPTFCCGNFPNLISGGIWRRKLSNIVSFKWTLGKLTVVRGRWRRPPPLDSFEFQRCFFGPRQGAETTLVTASFDRKFDPPKMICRRRCAAPDWPD